MLGDHQVRLEQELLPPPDLLPYPLTEIRLRPQGSQDVVEVCVDVVDLLAYPAPGVVVRLVDDLLEQLGYSDVGPVWIDPRHCHEGTRDIRRRFSLR
jgi:hypothetical protein